MKTFVIIKPDAIGRGLIGKIISRFEDAGLTIRDIKLTRKSTGWFDRMYPHLNGNVRSNMYTFMLHTPLIGIVLSGHDAIKRVRRMVGVTDSTVAAIGTIRGDFGCHPIRYNCIHASDSTAAGIQEIDLFFGDNNDG
jgi:nucleoside-diphosphate kinase